MVVMETVVVLIRRKRGGEGFVEYNGDETQVTSVSVVCSRAEAAIISAMTACSAME